jgi:dihydroorotase
MEGITMPASIEKTFVNGHMVYGNGVFDESKWGARMEFRRD